MENNIILYTDENGKTDVISGVSIGINDFLKNAQECIDQATAK